MRGLGIDAAIHFDVHLSIARSVPVGGAFHFFHLIGTEWLAAESRMHGHHEQHVDLVEKRFDKFEICFRIQSQSDAAFRIANLLQGFADIMFCFRFHVNSDRVRAGVDKARQIMIGVFDHQVDIEPEFGLFADEADDRRPKGDVVYEMAVHDVAMDPIGAGLLNSTNFPCQV